MVEVAAFKTWPEAQRKRTQKEWHFLICPVRVRTAGLSQTLPISLRNRLEVICRTTGMGFAAVARVTQDRWIACAVCDEIAFGLLPGEELDVKTTIGDEIRDSGRAVVIDHVAESELLHDHHTPRMYGLQSYISMLPIVLPNGAFFGTLCAIDPRG